MRRVPSLHLFALRFYSEFFIYSRDKGPPSYVIYVSWPLPSIHIYRTTPEGQMDLLSCLVRTAVRQVGLEGHQPPLLIPWSPRRDKVINFFTWLHIKIQVSAWKAPTSTTSIPSSLEHCYLCSPPPQSLTCSHRERGLTRLFVTSALMEQLMVSPWLTPATVQTGIVFMNISRR